MVVFFAAVETKSTTIETIHVGVSCVVFVSCGLLLLKIYRVGSKDFGREITLWFCSILSL